MVNEGKTLSKAKNGDKIATLSKELSLMLKETPINSVVSIIATADVINQYLRKELRRSESTQAQLRILNNLIKKNGSARLTDMSEILFRSKCAITRVVDNLEKACLVKREPADGDRREKIITITEKGIKFIEKTMQQRRIAADQIMSCLDEDKMAELIGLLEQVRGHVRGFVS
jgi:DNA-binding MarR family transcriptional regulator